MVGIITIIGDQITVFIVNIQIKVGVSVSAHDNISGFSASE